MLLPTSAPSRLPTGHQHRQSQEDTYPQSGIVVVVLVVILVVVLAASVCNRRVNLLTRALHSRDEVQDEPKNVLRPVKINGN
jgi:hypothetical protein